MTLIVRFLFGLIIALTLLVAAAHSESRLALVIGNGAYTNLSKEKQLPSPVRDASDIAATLQGIGFDVMEGNSSNLTLREMLDRVEALAAAVKPGDTVLFYYSGHGIALASGNYFLPSDIPALLPGQDQHLIQASLSEATVIQMMQSKGAAGVILIIDACRNNPLAKAGGKGMGEAAGLIPRSPVKGVFSLYAAGYGQIALDRLSGDDTDPNSVFTRVLIPLLKTKGLTQTALAKDVQSNVEKLASDVGHEQFPAYYDQVRGVFSFNPGEAPKVEPQPEIAQGECDEALLVSTGVGPRCLRPGDEFTDCEGCPTMVVVPKGSFSLSSSEIKLSNKDPPRIVTIAKPFAVGKFEVTIGQYAAFVKATGHVTGDFCYVSSGINEYTNRKDRSFRDPGYKISDDHPVACVSWHDAQAYLIWLSGESGIAYRLLTETEWDYAASAGSKSKAHSDNPALDNPSEVGRYSKNGFGLHDMKGNLSEWVENCFEDNYKDTLNDGVVRKDNSDCKRVYRGFFSAFDLLNEGWAARGAGSLDTRASHLGFRIARIL